MRPLRNLLKSYTRYRMMLPLFVNCLKALTQRTRIRWNWWIGRQDHQYRVDFRNNLKPSKENMAKTKVKARPMKGDLVCHQVLKIKEKNTATIKVKAKPKKGDLVCHQVLRTKEKTSARERKKAGI